MRWKRVSDYALVSECEQYSIAKVFLRDVVHYEAWRTPMHPERRLQLATRLATKEAAMEVCRRDDEALRDTGGRGAIQETVSCR